ncbi:tyrosine-type recombinase/integrase [Alcaligenes faecalis]|uniref:tyrosine-type recombinase/integrase n=1 Tax=Alcaligenes faecalis TaxID=511 RepID=UPI0034D59642
MSFYPKKSGKNSTMAQYLELKNGIYYVRVTRRCGTRQVAKRYSLKTSNYRLAKMLSIQFLAHIHMSIKKFEVVYNDQGDIIRLKVDSPEDKANFLEVEELRQKHLRWKQEQENHIEKLRIEADLQAKQKEREQWEQSDNASLYEKLMKTLPVNAKTLRKLLDEYLENNTFKNEQTSYKYKREVNQLITFCDTLEVYNVEKLDRKVVNSYILYLRNTEKKEDGTIKNKLNCLSTFYNYLIKIGETKETNPFPGHINKKKIKKQDKRASFTSEEIQKIFTYKSVKEDKQFYFILLLLLTSGARPSEICQLYADDIQETEYDFYSIRITENKDRSQTLKTENSERTIYLNPLLINLGFLDYLKTRDKTKPLFDIKKWKGRNISVKHSELFTKTLIELDIKDDNKVLYSLRHTAINRLYQKSDLINNVDLIIQDLMGHTKEDSKQTTAQEHYKDELNLKLLYDTTVEYLSYKEVDFFD